MLKINRRFAVFSPDYLLFSLKKIILSLNKAQQNNRGDIKYLRILGAKIGVCCCGKFFFF